MKTVRFAQDAGRRRGASAGARGLVLALAGAVLLACDARGRVGTAPAAPELSAIADPPRVPPSALDVELITRDEEGEARMRADIEVLASERFAGRATGEEGARLTTEMIAERFRSLGLAPRGDATDDKGAPLATPSYLYRFSAQPNADVDEPSLTLVSDASTTAPKVPPRSIQVVDGSGSGEVTAPLVEVGFGVSTEGWDDYAGANVEGRIVVVRRGAPPIPGRTESELYELSKFRRKIRIAKAHKAVGLIVVSSTNEIPPPPIDPRNAGLPAIVMERSVAPRIFGDTALDDAATWKPKAPTKAQPIAHVRATLRTHTEDLGHWANDVVGWIPAAEGSPSASEWVVLGAHHDHLGMGGANSMAPGVHRVHPGADDNASGTATLLEVARTLSRLPHRPARNLLFIAFGAEELGLIGSREWCDEPTVPIDHVVAMVNADMVGRLRQGKLTIEGTGAEDGWVPFFAPARAGLPLDLDRVVADKFGSRSDHASFRDVGVPAAFLFTGLHPDYHRPTDTADKINYVGLEDIATFTARLVLGVSERGFERKKAQP
ncbi:MAG: M20/M25/M40 family metallo-hydrolase [Polyangiaceae bacterium]